MTVNNTGDCLAIKRAVDASGAVLPPDLAAALDHLSAIQTSGKTKTDPRQVVNKLAAANIGKPDALDKAYATAAKTLPGAVTAESMQADLVAAMGRQVARLLTEQADTVGAAFGDALADHIGTLAEATARLPEGFHPAKAADLDAATFAAWTMARDALEHITRVTRGLDNLYPDVRRTYRQYNATTGRALRYTAPGPVTSHRAAADLIAALHGTRNVRGGRAAQPDGDCFMPRLVLDHGGSIAWGTPSQVLERLAVIEAGYAMPVTSEDRVSKATASGHTPRAWR